MDKRIMLTIGVLIQSAASYDVIAQENCNTALTRIGRKAAEKAIIDHQHDACSGLKFKVLGTTIGIDKTKKLQLVNYKLCENRPIVNGTITVRVQCATSDDALRPTSKEDDLTAVASANLDTCQILQANITGGSNITQFGLDLGNVDKKFREEAQKKIAQFCR